MKKKTPTKELRYMAMEDFELLEDAPQPKLVGYASVFNQTADIMGMWKEKVAPGAFKKTIRENDIRALWNHDTSLVLGRNKAGTLKLSEDDKGLKVEIIPPDTQAGRDALVSIRRGDVTQMSIAFQTIKQDWPGGENSVRTLKEVKLFEVSPVTFPAFEATSINARSYYEPEAAEDPRDEALRLVLAADHGLELTNEQRQVIAEAMEMYKAYLPEPESNDDHSGQVDEPEPEDDGHYSAMERMRKLEEMSRAYGLPL